MHPDGGNKNEIEAIAQFPDLTKIGQLVVYPMNALIPSRVLRQLSQTNCRFYRNNVPTTRCKGTGIATATCADIQSKACFVAKEGEPVLVNLFEGQGLVLGEEVLGVFVVGTVTHAAASFAACCHIKFGIGVRSFQVILIGWEPV